MNITHTEITKLIHLLHSTGIWRNGYEDELSRLAAINPEESAFDDKKATDWMVHLTDDEAKEFVELERQSLDVAKRRLEIKDKAMCREFHRLANEFHQLANEIAKMAKARDEEDDPLQDYVARQALAGLGGGAA